jgi:alkylhydroperoxidase family enzyme
MKAMALLTARDKAALRWAEAIAWDPGLADDDLWAELHHHFTEPELVELGYFIGLTMGQQRFRAAKGQAVPRPARLPAAL